MNKGIAYFSRSLLTEGLTLPVENHQVFKGGKAPETHRLY